MKREDLLQKALSNDKKWDVIVIGGGATGLGAAVDAATRGYKTLLLERFDFSKATSSRSTKLVHGGVRYLEKGDVALVVEALRERGRILRNAPQLTENMRFIIGCYRWWEKIFYTVGLTIYDLLSGRYALGRSRPLSKKEVMREIPGLKHDHLLGGVVYHDGQFDDARMAITLMQTAVEKGAVCLNYQEVTGFEKDKHGKISGVNVTDLLSGKKYAFATKSIINATGVFVDEVMRMDEPEAHKKVRPSQGVHLLVDAKFWQGNTALMIPKTKDGRVLFGVPWHGKVLLGTTDTPLKEPVIEPEAQEQEINFILDQAGQYMAMKPTRTDVLSVFAGLRPLAAPSHDDSKKTKEISRGHKIYVSPSGLVTITGGKWTTYRRMAEEVVDRAAVQGFLTPKRCETASLKLHGYTMKSDKTTWNYVYGSDLVYINKMIAENPEYGERLDEQYTFLVAHVVWAARKEMAQTVEDVLARRVRALFIDARAAKRMAPKVAAILSKELGYSQEWADKQIVEFNLLADRYILDE